MYVLVRLADLERAVEILFEGLYGFGDQAALLPAIDEVEGLALDHQRAHEAPLDHAIQIVAGAQIREALQQNRLGSRRRARCAAGQCQQSERDTTLQDAHGHHWTGVAAVLGHSTGSRGLPGRRIELLGGNRGTNPER